MNRFERVNRHNSLLRGWAATSLALALISTGCNGISTKQETAARDKVHLVGSQYRPGGAPPVLPTLTADSGLSNFLTYAMLKRPSIEAAYYDWAASVERITQARSFPDPQFSFQLDIQNIVTSVMPGLMGTIPWPGKLRLGAEIASAESEGKYASFRAAVLETAFEVKRSYFQLHFLDERIRVNQQTLSLLSDLEKLARAQNEVGKVTLQDVLRAQIEQDRVRSETASLEDSRRLLLAQFKAALGLAAAEASPPVPRGFEPTSLELTSDEVFETALAQNQRLKAMEADVRAAEASIALARKSRLPDFSLGFMADAKTDPTLYRLPGGPGTVSLPIWRDKIRAQIAEAQDNKRAAQARLSEEQISLAVNFAEKAFLYREANRNLALLRNQLLPKAKQSLAVARSGYLAGQIDFFNVTDAERTLLGFELDQVEASTQREVVLAELSLLIAGMSPIESSVAAPGTQRSSMRPAPSQKTSNSPRM